MNNDNSIEPNRNRNLLLELVVFSLIFLLAAYFRFISLRANPGWYSDEGTFIEFAAHLAQGQWQIFGMQNAPMVIQRPPLFLFVLSVAFKLFGSDILVLGVLTSFYGLSCVALIYLLGRKMLAGIAGSLYPGNPAFDCCLQSHRADVQPAYATGFSHLVRQLDVFGNPPSALGMGSLYRSCIGLLH